MPYISEKIIIANTDFDKRIKLTPHDKETIFEVWNNGMGIRAIARLYGVDKRLIQFILFPERHERSLELREQRGGSARYYDKDKQRTYIKTHRRYKQSLYVSGLI